MREFGHGHRRELGQPDGRERKWLDLGEVRNRYREHRRELRLSHRVADVLAQLPDAARMRDCGVVPTKAELDQVLFALTDLRDELARGWKVGDAEREAVYDLSTQTLLETRPDDFVAWAPRRGVHPAVMNDLKELWRILGDYPANAVPAEPLDLLTLVDTATYVVGGLLEDYEAGRWNERDAGLFLAVVQFVGLACVQVLVEALAAFSVKESPATEAIKATVEVAAGVVGTKLVAEVMAALRPPDLPGQLYKVMTDLSERRENLRNALQALTEAPADVDLRGAVASLAAELRGMAYAARRMAPLVAEGDTEFADSSQRILVYFERHAILAAVALDVAMAERPVALDLSDWNLQTMDTMMQTLWSPRRGPNARGPAAPPLSAT